MDLAKFQTFIARVSGVSCYPDVVPETAELPAISYMHISDLRSRDLTGEVSGKRNTWRLSLVGKNLSSVSQLAATIENLDNSSSAEYQNVFIRFSTINSSDLSSPHRRAFVDIETYERGL